MECEVSDARGFKPREGHSEGADDLQGASRSWGRGEEVSGGLEGWARHEME